MLKVDSSNQVQEQATSKSIEMHSAVNVSSPSSPSASQRNPIQSMSVDSNETMSGRLSKSQGHDSAPAYIPGQASITSCVINLANTILGSGMLGLPYAFAQTGHILGTFLMVFAACSSSLALHFLSECALSDKLPSSFYSVATKALPKLTVLIDGAVAIKCFGVATSYLIVIGDVMPDAMQYMQNTALPTHKGLQARELWITMGWLSIFPLCLLRNVDSLKYTSFAAVIFVMFLGILIVLYSFNMTDNSQLNPCADILPGSPCKGPQDNFDDSINSGKVFSIFIFAFTCQQNIFFVVNEIKTPVITAINKVIACSIGLAVVVYLIVAVCGYETYGSLVQSDVLLNYPRNATTTLARVFVGLLVAFSYPLQQHPARRSIMSILDHYYVDPMQKVADARNATGLDLPLPGGGSSAVAVVSTPESLEAGLDMEKEAEGKEGEGGAAYRAERRASAAKAKAAILQAQEIASEKSLSEITAKQSGLAAPAEPLVDDNNASSAGGVEGASQEEQKEKEMSPAEREKAHAHAEKKAAAAKAKAAILAAKAAANTPRAQHGPPSVDFGDNDSRSTSLNDSGEAGAGAGAGASAGGEEGVRNSVQLCGYDTGLVARDFRYWSSTLTFLVLSYIIALSVDDLGVVLAFVGATGSTMVSYILPGFCYYLIFDEASGAPKWKRYTAFAQGVAGLIIVPVCLTFIFLKAKPQAQ